MPVLHVASAMGTRLSLYEGHRNKVAVPTPIPVDLERQTDTTPRACWDYDLLEGEGEKRFMQVVDEIRHAC